MDRPTDDDLFALADAARTMDAVCGGCDDYDDDDIRPIFTNGKKGTGVRTGKTRIINLPDGDVHVCYGTQCRDLVLDGDRQLVCPHSGIVFGVQPATEHEVGWAGRSGGSANPDDNAGTPAGGWMKRRDMFSASVQAWSMARTSMAIDASKPQTQVEPVAPKETHAATKERPAVKRGALCVDEPDAASSRRTKTGKREVWAAEVVRKLTSEASLVVTTLLSGSEPAAAAPAAAPVDARLQNVQFVRSVALRKLVRACAAGDGDSQVLTLDAIHNVCIHSNEFVRQTRHAQKERDAAGSGAGPSRQARKCEGNVIRILTELIVSLWKAACATPYMTDHRKSNDSFRPFAAGILYSLKRGLYMDDGTCIVPVLDSVSTRLPGLRSNNTSAAAKMLQSSSHKGICSLQRSISSLQDMAETERRDVDIQFAYAASRAALLREVVSTGR